MAEYIERGTALRVVHIMRPEDKRLEAEMGQIPRRRRCAGDTL